MKIEFLLRDKKTLNSYENVKIQNDIEREKGIYKVNKGNMYFLTYCIPTNNLKSAHKLAEFRDSLPCSNDAKLTVDEPSIKYSEILFKYMSEFEIKLRQALTLAICADKENFDNEFIGELDQKSLGNIYTEYLFNLDFVDSVQKHIKNHRFNKIDMIEYLQSVDEGLPWDSLFDSEDLPTIKAKFSRIKSNRNSIMHFHRISKNEYLDIRNLMAQAIDELDSYIDSAKENIEDPKPRAQRAKTTLNRIYANQDAIRKALELDQSFLASRKDLFSSADYYQSLGMIDISKDFMGDSISRVINTKDTLPNYKIKTLADYASTIKSFDIDNNAFSLSKMTRHLCTK